MQKKSWPEEKKTPKSKKKALRNKRLLRLKQESEQREKGRLARHKNKMVKA